MPTYQNQTTDAKSFNGEDWAPNETKPVSFFVPPGVGLTETSDLPHVVSPTLACDELVFADEHAPPVRIPIGDCAAFVSVFVVKSGAVELRENYAHNTVPIRAGTTTPTRIVAKRTEMEAIHVKPLSEAVVDYVISRASSGK